MKAVFLAVLFLAGCASAPSQHYRPANYSGPAWVITGEHGSFTRSITVFVNEKTALEGRLSMFGGAEINGGEFEGRKVSAHCVQKWGSAVDCLVFIDNERAASLSF